MNWFKKHVKLTVIVGALVVFLFGIGVGGASSDEGSADTEVKTETEKVEVVPDACETAIGAAEDIDDVFNEFVDTVQPLPVMVSDAAEAGANMDADAIDSLTEDLDSITGEVEQETKDRQDATDRFVAAREECLAAAGEDS